MNLEAKDIQNWLNEFTEKIDENKAYLSDLDTPIGDGDHGNNMARGMKAYQEDIEKKKPETITDTFRVISMALISKVGGASGPLYGSAFMSMTKATKDVEVITSSKQLGEIITEGLKGIQARGKAELGDKTMVDVWLPVASALMTDTLTKQVVEDAKSSTKDMVAKKGRASYLGERAIGHIDPGAASSALLFDALINQFN
ncbi:dihydroxyacetone kinase subunit DhaL [Vagococcus vulneris]|uniref:phosphoenolpyruvate--glycerone phosphotransferase n=1 Tax=Vagococcus vulneris TaxID=1977869 RepID=A0A429ZZS8_9ENTE|nr:dihydroxyacetone kinase subunit DhaL [Vagococcus vulneris]RST99526.1 dihydroxyacetone kinase subunit L [Vagococcus vulneris]